VSNPPITGDIYYHGVEGEIEEEFWRFSYHTVDALKKVPIGSSELKRQLHRGFKRHNVSLAYQRNGRTLDIYWNDKKSVFNLESVFPVQSENLLKIFPSDIDNEAWLITDCRLFRVNLGRLPLDDGN
jgi:hypothetical protein